MPEPVDDLTTLEPFELLKRADETAGEYIRVVVTLHAGGACERAESALSHHRWIVDGIGSHVHPTQEEYFCVRAGSLHVETEHMNRTLKRGDAITLPANVPHRHWNPTGDPARIVVEHRPAQRSDDLLLTLYSLAQAGKTDENGIPNFLQSMVLQHSYANHAYSTDTPVWVQKALAALVAPVGRLAGYNSTHSITSVTDAK